MSRFQERVGYILGLCEGLNYNFSSDEGKILRAVIDALKELAREPELPQAAAPPPDGEPSVPVPLDDDDDALLEFDCPRCGGMVYFQAASFDIQQVHLCPTCGGRLFADT
jgi:hypothetical protein